MVLERIDPKEDILDRRESFEEIGSITDLGSNSSIAPIGRKLPIVEVEHDIANPHNMHPSSPSIKPKHNLISSEGSAGQAQGGESISAGKSVDESSGYLIIINWKCGLN